MTTKQWAIVLSVGALFGLLVSCPATWVMNGRTNRIVKQWPQPKDVDYKSFDPYTLSVIEGAIDWDNISFPRRHYVFIGRGAEAPGYGHSLDYTFHPGAADVDAHIGRSAVEWTPDGLTFIEATGQRLFVPKAMFVGGR